MSLAPIFKKAQQTPFTDLLGGPDSNPAFDMAYDIEVSEDQEVKLEPESIVTVLVTDPEDEEEIMETVEEIVDEDHESAFSFTLPHLPGSDFNVSDEEEIVVDETEIEDVEVQEIDKWDWKGHGLANYPGWLQNMSDNCPRHTGKDLSGIERCIAYFKEVLTTVSKAMRSDIKGELTPQAIAQVEVIRDEMHKAVERLEERADKIESNKYKKNKSKAKKSDYDESSIVKTAQKITGIEGLYVSVPLLIYSLARTCINGSVSAGHDIDDMFIRLSKKFKLTEREKYELISTIENMGWAVRRDSGSFAGEDIEAGSEDNFSFSSQYNA